MKNILTKQKSWSALVKKTIKMNHVWLKTGGFTFAKLFTRCNEFWFPMFYTQPTAILLPSRSHSTALHRPLCTTAHLEKADILEKTNFSAWAIISLTSHSRYAMLCHLTTVCPLWQGKLGLFLLYKLMNNYYSIILTYLLHTGEKMTLSLFSCHLN